MATAPIVTPARLPFILRALPFQAVTITHTFPSKLKPGEEIAGTITVTNPTATAYTNATVEVTLQWLGTSYKGVAKDVAANGGTASWVFPADFGLTAPVKMPNQDATITIRFLDSAGTKIAEISHTITLVWYYKQIMGLPLWMLLIILAIGVFGGVYYYMRKKGKK
jgi:hypothetical protein